jgi:L-asparaginase II
MVNPILVEMRRGGQIESVHRGAACVVDKDGKLLRTWGDVDAAVCPRSAIKPIQALPLIESGAADAFKVTDAEIALACASHSGEPEHVGAVAAWLARMGLGEKDLACGPHAPAHEISHAALLREGKSPGRLHNNCSGKHAGFLALAKHLGAPTKGYIAPGHAVQQMVLRRLGEMTGCAHTGWKTVCDGCSAPNVFLPLTALALGCARLGTAGGAAARIVDAMKAHPILISGHGRPCAALIDALSGRGVVKTGAEGVYVAVLPDQGLGVAVKIDDGAGRAATITLTAVLHALGAFKPESGEAVRELLTPPVTDWAGNAAGDMRPAAALT